MHEPNLREVVVTPSWGEVSDNYRTAAAHYRDNQIRTSKYSTLSFLPKNLF